MAKASEDMVFWTIAAVVCAVVTILVAGAVGFSQFHLTREVERARLTVKGTENPRIIWDPDEREPSRAWIVVPWSVVNVGRSPAFLFQQTMRVVLVDDELGPLHPPPLDKEDEPFGEIPITPTIPHSGEKVERFSPFEARQISPACKCILVYGIVRWVDVRGQSRFHQFAFAWRTASSHPLVWTYDPTVSRDYIRSG